MSSIKEILAGTIELQKDLAASYLFGSQTTDSTHPDSDVDVALLFLKEVNLIRLLPVNFLMVHFDSELL
ncbi:MAG: nucleotidyltransferase domain-containing protein [Candidatus Paceibacterota bacterium]